MMQGFAPAIAALSLLAAPAMAQSEATEAAKASAYLGTGGTWMFTAPRNAKKVQSLCYENWVFQADGSMSVQSGTQTVEKRWRVAEEDGFTKLYTTSLSSTDGTDCMGERANPADYPKEESGGFAVLFFANGTKAYLCNPVVMKNPDGTTTPMYRDEDCWGRLDAVLVPVPDGAPTAKATPTAEAPPVHSR